MGKLVKGTSALLSQRSRCPIRRATKLHPTASRHRPRAFGHCRFTVGSLNFYSRHSFTIFPLRMRHNGRTTSALRPCDSLSLSPSLLASLHARQYRANHQPAHYLLLCFNQDSGCCNRRSCATPRSACRAEESAAACAAGGWAL